MNTLSYTKRVVTDYKLNDIIRHVTKKSSKTSECMRVLSDAVRANRWEILGTFDGYKVVTNGYGEFKHIETTGDLSDKKVIPKSVVFNKLTNL